MPIQKKSEWLTALRSGKYSQAQGRMKDSISCSFCCLGVYAEVLGIPFNKNKNGYEIEDEDGNKFTNSHIPKELGGLTSQEIKTLAKLNDDDEHNFNQIADFIEKEID